MDPITRVTQGMQQPAQPTAKPEDTPKRSGLISPDKMYQSGSGRDNLVHATTVHTGVNAEGLWRMIIMDVLSVLLAAVFGYCFAQYLAGGLAFGFAIGSLLLWSAVSVLQGFIQKNFSRRFLVIFFEAIASIVFFYSFAWQSLAATCILVLLSLLWGYFSMRRELANTVEIRFFTASRKVVGKVVTAAVIFMIAMYASLANNNGNFFVSEQGFSIFFTWAAGFVNSFYPSVPLDGSVDDFAQAVAKLQLQNNPAFKSLSAQEQDEAVTEGAKQVVVLLSPEASSTPAIAQSQPASTAFYRYSVAQIGKLQAKFNNFFIGAWGLILFLVLRSAGIIVVWAGQFIALIFYELLLATRFMRITEQSATKETIEF